jgi:hypothetical protein
MNILATLLASVFISVGFLLAASSVDDSNSEGIIILSAAMLFFCISTIVGVARKGGTLIVVNGMYYMVFLSFPGMLHAASNNYPFYGMAYPESDVTRSATVLLVFSIAILAGQLFAYREFNNKYNNKNDVSSIRVARPYSIVLMALASAVLISIIGVDVFISRRSDAVFSDLEVASEVYVLLQQTVRTLAILSFVASLHRWKYARHSLGNFGLMAITLCLNVVANFPLNIPRFHLFAYIFIVMHLIVDVTRPGFKMILIGCIIIGVGTVFPLVSFLQRGSGGVDFEFDFIGYLQTNGDLDGFQSMINATLLVARDGNSWGWQLLSALLAFVPRSVWPDKGLPTGSLAADAAGYSFLNISMPLPSEFYVDFGMVGVAAGGLIVGIFLTRMDMRYNSFRKNRDLWTSLFIGGICGYLVILSRGTLLGVISPIGIYFMFSFILTRSPFSETRATAPLGSKVRTGGRRGYAQ